MFLLRCTFLPIFFLIFFISGYYVTLKLGHAGREGAQWTRKARRLSFPAMWIAPLIPWAQYVMGLAGVVQKVNENDGLAYEMHLAAGILGVLAIPHVGHPGVRSLHHVPILGSMPDDMTKHSFWYADAFFWAMVRYLDSFWAVMAVSTLAIGAAVPPCILVVICFGLRTIMWAIAAMSGTSKKCDGSYKMTLLYGTRTSSSRTCNNFRVHSEVVLQAWWGRTPHAMVTMSTSDELEGTQTCFLWQLFVDLLQFGCRLWFALSQPAHELSLYVFLSLQCIHIVTIAGYCVLPHQSASIPLKSKWRSQRKHLSQTACLGQWGGNPLPDCFLAITAFHSPEGWKLVQSLKKGDQVCLTNGSIAQVVHTNKHVKERVDLCEIRTNQARLKVSSSHPIKVEGDLEQFKKAKDVSTDDMVFVGTRASPVTRVIASTEKADLYDVWLDPNEVVEAFMVPNMPLYGVSVSGSQIMEAFERMPEDELHRLTPMSFEDD